MLVSFESQLYSCLKRQNCQCKLFLYLYPAYKCMNKWNLDRIYAFFSSGSHWLPGIMVNSHNQACFRWEKLFLIMTKGRHHLVALTLSQTNYKNHISRLPFSSRATLGSLWTGRIRSSARLWRPHSGLAWFIWGKGNNAYFFFFLHTYTQENHKIREKFPSLKLALLYKCENCLPQSLTEHVKNYILFKST